MTTARMLRDKAEAERAKHGGLGIATYAQAGPVLVALATDKCSCVIAIDKAELPTWRSHIELLGVLGVKLEEPTAMQKIKKGIK